MNPATNQGDIDFLPARYREQHARRRLNVWRLTVTLAFGALVGMGALHQWSVRWLLERELFAAQMRYEEQKMSILQLNELQDGLNTAQAEAQLFAFLAHPWPRTQILAAVLAPLSPEIHLSELRLAREVVERPPTAAPEPAIDPNAPPPEEPPLVTDLASLRDECEKTILVVLLEGTVDSTDSLQQSLAALARSPLVETADLQSLTADDQGQTQFRVRIKIRPGLGQPGGPPLVREAALAKEAPQ